MSVSDISKKRIVRKEGGTCATFKKINKTEILKNRENSIAIGINGCAKKDKNLCFLVFIMIVVTWRHTITQGVLVEEFV